VRRGFRSNRGDALDKRQLAASSRQTLRNKSCGTAASAERAGEKLPLGITLPRAGAKAAMLPTLEPENNHVAAVLTQQAGADQRQRFAHAGQCAPPERQLQAGGRDVRRSRSRLSIFQLKLRISFRALRRLHVTGALLPLPILPGRLCGRWLCVLQRCSFRDWSFLREADNFIIFFIG
jgi:hypothetical protein